MHMKIVFYAEFYATFEEKHKICKRLHAHVASTCYLLQMPFRIPVEEKLPVVACFAPIFYNERWQVLAALVEIYRQYGVNMQVFYIESALTSIMNYLQV